MAKEFYKFGPLIVSVHSIGIKGMLAVKVFGLGMEFETFVPGREEDMERIAIETVGELYQASMQPRLFIAKRRLALEQAGESACVKERMVEIAQKAVDFADIMRPYLRNAVHSANQRIIDEK